MPRDRFALISDIHANLEALTAVFEDIDALGVTDVRCLGDVVGYGADPEACTAMVAARCRWTILGNHDHGLGTPLRDFNPLAADALERTRKRLRPAWFRPGRKRNWEFLTSLPNRKEEGGFLFVHGSPRDPILEYLLKSDGFLDPDKLAANFAQIDRPCFVGHTHWPGWHDTTFRFTHARPRASYVVVDGRTVHFRRVAYDVAAAQSKILAAGFHPALAERLARGK
ncbi:MAG: metallophosphoesterase family protein [Planctomycetota bacterium]